MKSKKMRKVFGALALLSTAMAVMPAYGAEENVLDRVVVEAEKNKTAAGEKVYSRLKVPESAKAATETFSRDEIEQMQPRDVFDVIEKGLGMMYTYQGRKSLNFAQSRGGGTSMGIIIDGIYLPWSQSARMLANFPVDLIDRVTIVRDGSALTLGPLTALSSAQGSPNQGFVIITTRKPTALQNELKLAYGTFDTEKLHLFHGNKVGDYYYDVAYTKNRTDGKENWYNASSSESVYVKGGYEGKNFSSNISFYSDQAMRQFERGTLLNGTLDNSKWKYDPLDNCMVAVDVAKHWDIHNTTALSYGYSSVKDTMVTDSFAKSNPVYQPEINRVKEFNLWHTMDYNKDTVKVGAQAIRWHSPYGEISYATKEQREELYSYYLFDEHRVNNKLTLDGGVRVDRHHITTGTAMTAKRVNDVWAEDATSYALGAAYKLNSVYKLSSDFTYSKQPASEFLVSYQNKPLDTETRKKYEAGITANYNKAFNAALTVFYYDIDNYKLAVGTTGTGINQANVYSDADVGRKGMELGFNGRLSQQLSYNLGYSYITSSSAVDNSQVPRNTYTLRLNYKYNDFDANLSVQRVGAFIGGAITGNVGDATSVVAPVGDFTRVDLTISKATGKGSKVSIYGRNLTNEKYATIYKTGYYYDPGATYGIEYSKKF